jgi:hypothetical protein
MSGNNYSLHSIAGAYALGLAPHGYYLIKMMANAKGQASNIMCVVALAMTIRERNANSRISTDHERT